jgi:Gpi18-like mannosyltransferase
MINLDRAIAIKVLVIASILGIIFFPWQSSNSYGTFSGFDPGNLYLSPNSNFDFQLNSSQINVTSRGPGTEHIHLTLSDLPYEASFKITILNQSAYSTPLRVLIYYPLNVNQISVDFSSLDQFIHLIVINASGTTILNERLMQYSIGQSIDFRTKISTIQSSKEFISISISNLTTSSTVNLASDVNSLLRDQARAISVEIMAEGILNSDYLVFADDPFWIIQNYGEGLGNSTLVQSGDKYSIVQGNYSQNYLIHTFSFPENWSSYNAVNLMINGSGTNGKIRFWLNNDWNNRILFHIKDDFLGTKRFLFPLTNPDAKLGDPTFNSIISMGMDFPNLAGNWSISDFEVGKVVTNETSTAAEISDFNVNILPHSSAYAPLTTNFLLCLSFILSFLAFVFAIYRSSLKFAVKKLYSRLKVLKASRVLLFAITFLAIFALYFSLFGIGDHAFDMFSQKLWGYDMVKYGFISIYQRPALTSAAVVMGGEATQHAIFPYGPLAGLYYYVIGQTYFLLSSNPNVMDPLFTTIVKSFQTLVTLACGILAFKILRVYGSSFRASFGIMILFLLNPLIIYNSAVWGHQDLLLIFFLLLSLWAYESNHPMISYFGIALAILLKSTAFAPALLMMFLLIRKFGFRRLIDGTIVGISAGIASIIPFVSMGASPLMLYNSTFIRVLQFGTLALQYPRSAAVSPDGFNLWPIITYFNGAHGRDRMWYPDFNVLFSGVSYLVAGEIIFIIFVSILLYLATKKKAKMPSAAALLLGVLMIASTMFLTKTTARYLVFGVAYLLLVSSSLVDKKTKWLVIGILTFTSVFAMHGLLVGYTGSWTNLYPAMSPSIPINGLILSLYESDIVISEMVIANLFAFFLIVATTINTILKREDVLLKHSKKS